MLMKLSFLVLTSQVFVASASRNFTDDFRVTHTFTSRKPRVVAWSLAAVALSHMGKLCECPAEMCDESMHHLHLSL